MLSDEPVNSSNMLNMTRHTRKKNLHSTLSKLVPDETVIQVNDGGESFLEEIDDSE